MGSSMTLYEITDRFKSFEALLDQEDLPDEVIADTFESLDAEWSDKAVAVAAFIKNLEHTAAGIEEAAKAMQKRADRLSKRSNALKSYLQFQMQCMNKTKVQSDLFVISIKKNPPAVQIYDELQIPDAYWYQPTPPPRQLDREAMKADLKAKKEVPGAVLFQGERVEIKA